MNEYHITVPTTKAVTEDALSASVEASLKTLRQFGYETNFQNRHGALVCQISATIDGKDSFSIKERLTPGVVNALSRFTERVSVQHALNNMYTRMVSIGWSITIADATILIDEKIVVEHPDGTTKTYAPTNAEMVRLRYDLDQAETHWIVGDKMPLFLEVGWHVQEASDGGYYILSKSSGGFDTITFGHVDQAKYCVEQAEKALADIRADNNSEQSGR